jgi:hypothetical protein
LEADPGETTDVLVSHPEISARLQAFIDRARSEIGDALTGSVGSRAQPPGRVDAPWGQNPLPNPENRADKDPAQ